MNEKKSFWTTTLGVLTAITGLIAAISGLIGGLYASGIIGNGKHIEPTQVTLTPVIINRHGGFSNSRINRYTEILPVPH